MRSNRTTWLLFLLAAVVAGFLALWNARERPPRRASPPPAQDDGTIEVEIAP